MVAAPFRPELFPRGDNVRRVLSIDGGGLKGALPAAFLTTIEAATGKRIVDQFDLIAGTSTGGIIALGLGLGFSAATILDFYRNEGPKIFATFGLFASLRQVGRAKYNPGPLREALDAILGTRLLGESETRLIIPAFDSTLGSVRVFKTSHHPRFEIDYKVKAVDIAMATAAAPTYFPAHETEAGSILVDGGVWANNPVGIAVVESVSVLRWPNEEIRVLSLGCTGAPLDFPINAGFRHTRSIIDLIFQGQSAAALGTAKLLINHTSANPRLFRIDPTIASGTFSLDDPNSVSRLIGIGETKGREFLPAFRAVFHGPKEPFEPAHR
jgi:hypothetical protein